MKDKPGELDTGKNRFCLIFRYVCYPLTNDLLDVGLPVLPVWHVQLQLKFSSTFLFSSTTVENDLLSIGSISV